MIRELYHELTTDQILMALEQQFNTEHRYTEEARAKRVTEYAEEFKVRAEATELAEK